MPRALALVVLAALAGCGGEPAAVAPTPGPTTTTTTTTSTAPEPERRVVDARCPSGAGNCTAATGRILYLERVDPDGDGDLHLVIAGGGVTGPGFSVLDIEKELRPRLDPHVGDTASAAGPVYRGSFGQRQIQATELHILRRR
ncbi:MAG: hypothetical protein ACJ762_00635 [Solirubrobacteraceae bacterium]